MEYFKWLLSATAGESRGVVNYGQLGWPSLPARFTGDDPGWLQAEDGFRNNSADCYIICAVQMLGASRILRQAILRDIPSGCSGVLAALYRDFRRSLKSAIPFCHVAEQCGVLGVQERFPGGSA